MASEPSGPQRVVAKDLGLAGLNQVVRILRMAVMTDSANAT